MNTKIKPKFILRATAMMCSIILMTGMIGCGTAKVTETDISDSTDEVQQAIDVMGDDSPESAPDNGRNTVDEPDDIEDEASQDHDEQIDAQEIREDEDLMKTKYDKHGALHVNNEGKLVDHNGEIVVLRGYSTHGINLYDEYVNREFLEYMRDEWKIDIIRLAMYTTEDKGYCISGEENKKRLLEVIDRGVKAATELGLYVIIDWHILSDGNPGTYEDQAIDFFDKVSEKYASYGNVFYEICNEPNTTATWEDVRAYADRVIPCIRKHDKYSVILVGTPSWCQRLDEAVSNPIMADDNLMYCLHFYADTHRDELRRVCSDALKARLPIFVSEFGTCAADGAGNHNKEESDKWISLLDENDISYVMWNISNKNETSAMLMPECDSVTGPYSDDDLRESAKWYREVLLRQ